MTQRWRKLKRFVFLRVLHADDPPHSLALGFAIGLVFALLPTIGLQMILAAGVAALLRANKILAAAATWITNPLTTVPVTYLNWCVGRYFVRTAAVADPSSVQDQIVRIVDHAGGLSGVAWHILDKSFWAEVLQLMWVLGVELWIGSAIVGAVCALPAYFIMRWALTAYRRRVPRPRLFNRSARKLRGADALRAARPRLQKQSA